MVAAEAVIMGILRLLGLRPKKKKPKNRLQTALGRTQSLKYTEMLPLLPPLAETLRHTRGPFEAAGCSAGAPMPHPRRIHRHRRRCRTTDPWTAAARRPAARQHQGTARRADRLPERVGRRGLEARGDTVAKLARPLGLTFEEVWELQRRRT